MVHNLHNHFYVKEAQFLKLPNPIVSEFQFVRADFPENAKVSKESSKFFPAFRCVISLPYRMPVEHVFIGQLCVLSNHLIQPLGIVQIALSVHISLYFRGLHHLLHLLLLFDHRLLLLPDLLNLNILKQC